jgi:3-oxoacyl-[acyl-carrier-protein] synthase-3
MSAKIKTVITATGKCIPEVVIKNTHFLNHNFVEKDGSAVTRQMEDVVRKFQAITDIEERRYALPTQNASELAYLAALDAIESSKEDREQLDYIIVAHNFGDIKAGDNRTDMVPTLASRVKYKLGIVNPNCVAYDLPFGCPGWLQGMIQADYYIKSGDAKKVMVIGSETLSRVIDPHDKDSMIYADGAGATILSAKMGDEEQEGIISHKTQTHTLDQAWFLRMQGSSKIDYQLPEDLYLKMDGRKVYEYGLTHVPLVMQSAVERAGISYDQIKKVFVHQANGKMDEAILKRFFKLYQQETSPEGIMPMTIAQLGNSSVATIPTLLDMVMKNKMPSQEVKKGDYVIFASVGAGMNINALVYRF